MEGAGRPRRTEEWRTSHRSGVVLLYTLNLINLERIMITRRCPSGLRGLLLLANGFAGQTLGVSCMQWALETTPAGIVFAILAITPIIIIPFARVLEGERPTKRSLIGGGIAVAGVIALALAR